MCMYKMGKASSIYEISLKTNSVRFNIEHLTKSLPFSPFKESLQSFTLRCYLLILNLGTWFLESIHTDKAPGSWNAQRKLHVRFLQFTQPGSLLLGALNGICCCKWQWIKMGGRPKGQCLQILGNSAAQTSGFPLGHTESGCWRLQGQTERGFHAEEQQSLRPL